MDRVDVAKGAGVEPSPALMDTLKRCYLLVLDQCADTRTEWERQQLEELLDWRYSEEARPTMLVADTPVQQWGSARIQSRVQDAAMCRRVIVQAADYRPQRVA